MTRITTGFVADEFAARFDAAPEGIWSVPGRVSVMGDHTDIEDGLTLGHAVNRRSFVAVSRRSDSTIRVRSNLSDFEVDTTIEQLLPPTEHAWYDYPLGVIWAVLAHVAEMNTERTETCGDEAVLIRPTGLDIFLTTDVTIGAGLASSASVCGAMSLALNDLWQLELTPQQLAQFGYQVEKSYVRASSGPADHVTCMTADAGVGVFYDARGNDVSPIPVSDLGSLGAVELLVYSGETHRNWERNVADRHDACDRVAKALGYQYLREVPHEEFERTTAIDETDRRRAGFVLSEMQRVLDAARALRENDLQAFGQLMNESHQQMRDDFEVTSERIDIICDLARSQGAFGARLSGSGFGGAVVVVIPVERVDGLIADLREAFNEYGWGEVAFEPSGTNPGPSRDA